MTDCGCEKARLEMQSYVDHELHADDARDIKEHLGGCVSCATEAEVQVVITEVVRRSCRDEVAPDELKGRVLEALRACCRD